jgi:hypothetical protein
MPLLSPDRFKGCPKEEAAAGGDVAFGHPPDVVCSSPFHDLLPPRSALDSSLIGTATVLPPLHQSPSPWVLRHTATATPMLAPATTLAFCVSSIRHVPTPICFCIPLPMPFPSHCLTFTATVAAAVTATATTTTTTITTTTTTRTRAPSPLQPHARPIQIDKQHRRQIILRAAAGRRTLRAGGSTFHTRTGSKLASPLTRALSCSRWSCLH